MQAYLAILRYDVIQLAHSWLLRTWIALLVLAAAFFVAVAASQEEKASETLAVYVLAVVAPVSALAVAIIGGTSVSGEAAIASDSILARSVTRTEYVAAKVTSRLLIAVAVLVAVMAPISHLILRYSSESDASTAGVIAGSLMLTAVLLAVLAPAIALSTFLRSSFFAALIALAASAFLAGTFYFIGLSWLSSWGVFSELAATFRGETALWREIAVIVAYGLICVFGVAAAFVVFRRRDL